MATRPLSDLALSELRRILETPAPTQTFNPGIVHKLTSEGFAEITLLQSPFASHKGRKVHRISHLKITDFGKAVAAK